MNIKKIKYICSVLCITLLISGCNITSPIIDDECVIGKVMEYLTSDECNGRLVGTEGNRLAEKYIADMFEGFGLSPYKGNYYQPYEQSITIIDNSKVKLRLSSGEIKDFIYGQDFIESRFCNEEIKLPIYTEAKDKEECIVIVENHEDLRYLLVKENVKGILMLQDILHRSPPSPQKYENKNVFYITKDTYNLLKNNIGETVEIAMSYKDETLMVNNVLGRIPGRTSEKAILITAHLDHLGGTGDYIWRGALDDSSGVAVLLEMARRLGEYSKENTFSRDILFCATNGEETGLKGSKNLYDLLKKDYIDIIDINFDCIGEKNVNEVLIECKGNDKMVEFSKNIVEFLNKNDIKSTFATEIGVSDHLSFDNSMLITTGFDSEPIHTIADTVDKVDVKAMKKITDNLVDLLIQYSLNDKQISISRKSEAEEKKAKEFKLDKEREKMKFGEYKFIKINGRSYYLSNTLFSGTLEEVNDIFDNNFTFIPQELSNKQLNKIDINTSKSVYYNTPLFENHEEDKIYGRDDLIGDINNIFLSYGTEDEIGISMSLGVYIKESDIDMKNYNRSFSKEDSNNTLETKNHTYYLINTEEELLDTLILMEEDENKIYTTTIYGEGIEGNSSEKITEFIEENDIDIIITNFIKCMSNITINY